MKLDAVISTGISDRTSSARGAVGSGFAGGCEHDVPPKLLEAAENVIHADCQPRLQPVGATPWWWCWRAAPQAASCRRISAMSLGRGGSGSTP